MSPCRNLQPQRKTGIAPGVAQETPGKAIVVPPPGKPPLKLRFLR
jgi:hypothetical protein